MGNKLKANGIGTTNKGHGELKIKVIIETNMGNIKTSLNKNLCLNA
jgi:hypothetical protein